MMSHEVIWAKKNDNLGGVSNHATESKVFSFNLFMENSKRIKKS